MAILLGLDTGGTYTDAVLLRDEKEVIAKAKALTTRHDLSVGIGEAVRAVLKQAAIDPGDIAMAALSTTLATNALVEGQGGRIALVSIGFSPADLGRQGLGDALGDDPVLAISGGHLHSGLEAHPLDLAALDTGLNRLADSVPCFAVVGHFATRNPAHEVAVRDHIRARTGKPVSCSYELSAKLNGPKRAATAVLNARLIGLIDHLIDGAEALLQGQGIEAPLMVVRGDGALISTKEARLSPIETILSGPAASLVGASWLTGEKNALVADIGGTTTDIAVLSKGRPRIDPDGARVGPHRTMVEAVAMRTTGLGGDSEVHVSDRAGEEAQGLFLGPLRLVPLSLLATQHPDLVHGALARAANMHRQSPPAPVRFVLPVCGGDQTSDGLGAREKRLLLRIGKEVQDVSGLLEGKLDEATLARLVQRGLVQISGVTPSDAAHVLGLQSGWDGTAAEKALDLMSFERDGAGNRLADTARSMAERIIERLVSQTAEALLVSALSEDVRDWEGIPPEALARHVLLRAGLEHHRDLMAFDASVNLPIIGLGASAQAYYGLVGDRLSAQMILPEHGDVANALGAVVGQISARASGGVTRPSEGCFRVHFPDGPKDYTHADKALDALEKYLGDRARTEACETGANEVHLTVKRDIRRSTVEGQEFFVEADITVIASGRPRFATG